MSDNEEYVNKFKRMYDKCKQNLKNTLFINNFYENPKFSLMKPKITTIEEEYESFRSYKKTKSKIVRDTLYNQYLVAALYLASLHFLKFNYKINDIDEFISFDTTELMTAIEHYDCDDKRNASFLTYFISRQNALVNTFVTSHSDYLCGRGVRERFEAAKRAICKDDISYRNALLLSPKKFRETYGFNKFNFIKCLSGKIKCFSELEMEVNDGNVTFDDDDLSFLNTLADNRIKVFDENKFLIKEMKEYLKNKVSDRDLKIWDYYFNDEHGRLQYEYIGNQFNITRERVRQIINRCNNIILKSKIYKDAIC